MQGIFSYLLVQTKFVMNQILNTELKQKNKKSSEKKNWFKFQFTFSILIVCILTFGGSFYLYYLQKKEKSSKSLIANYNIYRLYSINENNSHLETSNNLFRNY